MRRQRSGAALAALVLVAGLGACAPTRSDDRGPSGAGDPDGAATRLARQRDEVRAAARTLLRGAEQRLAGTTTQSAGGWRGCESAGIDEYQNFRYLAQARVDAAPGAAAPPLTALRTVLQDAGFTPGEAGPGPGGGGSASLAGRRGDVTAVFSTAGGPSVGLDAYGPCIDVPEDERDDWLRRDEPTPSLLRR
jgi:hypothetical protein